MPLLSTGSKAIEGFADNKDVTMLIPKFSTSNDMDLLSHVRLEISITDVGCPNSKLFSSARNITMQKPQRLTTPE